MRIYKRDKSRAKFVCTFPFTFKNSFSFCPVLALLWIYVHVSFSLHLLGSSTYIWDSTIARRLAPPLYSHIPWNISYKDIKSFLFARAIWQSFLNGCTIFLISLLLLTNGTSRHKCHIQSLNFHHLAFYSWGISKLFLLSRPIYVQNWKSNC